MMCRVDFVLAFHIVVISYFLAEILLHFNVQLVIDIFDSIYIAVFFLFVLIFNRFNSLQVRRSLFQKDFYSRIRLTYTHYNNKFYLLTNKEFLACQEKFSSQNIKIRNWIKLYNKESQKRIILILIFIFFIVLFVILESFLYLTCAFLFLYPLFYNKTISKLYELFNLEMVSTKGIYEEYINFVCNSLVYSNKILKITLYNLY